MRRAFGAKKDKEPNPSLQESSDRINKRGETIDEKIKKLDAELARYKDQIKKTRPGPAQEAIKARAMRVLKQKRVHEGQRDMLYNQTFNLDQVAFAADGIKDAQQTFPTGKGSRLNLQDEMLNLMDVSNEIQKFLDRSYNVTDHIDKDELLCELGAQEAIMGFETESNGVPAYLQPDMEVELDLPSAPMGKANVQAVDELGLPSVPQASLRG